MSGRGDVLGDIAKAHRPYMRPLGNVSHNGRVNFGGKFMDHTVFEADGSR
jgi:hypothetical protein